MIKRHKFTAQFAFLYVCLLILNKNIGAATCLGCIELDEITFDKILPKFQYSLIKFDIAFPYGEKHEEFSAFAKNFGSKIDELLVGLVGVKDYGEKENSKLAQKYNVDDKAFPVIILYKNFSTENYVRYPGEKPVTLDNIKRFVKDETELYIGLDGCLKEFDLIAFNFAGKPEEEQVEILNKAKILHNQLESDKDSEKGKIYLIIMKRILEKGKNFIPEEQKRLENLLQGKLSDNKKRELMQKLNILQSFQAENEDSDKKYRKEGNDEL